MPLTQTLQFLLDEAIHDQKVPGAVLYLGTLDRHYEIASGIANQKKRRSIKPRDRFRIASISKMFVATVVLQLHEEEELDLSDRLPDWLPEEMCDRLENSDRISIRHLLNHTSGLDDYLETEEFQEAAAGRDYKDIWTPQEAIRFAYDLESLNPPGEERCYSNTNYILLELIVEAVTGNPLYVEMRDRILEPIGLKHTFTEARETLPGGFVEGYEDLDEDGVQDCTSPLNFGAGLGDGGLISTARDVGKFAETLFMTDDLLDEDSFDKMIDWMEDGEGGFYGLGVNSWDTEEWGDVWGHAGGVEGYSSTLWHLPDEEMTVVVLTNDGDRAHPDDIVERVLEVVMRN